MDKFSFQVFSLDKWKWLTLDGRVKSEPTIYSREEADEMYSNLDLFKGGIRVMVKNRNSWIVYDPNEFNKICWKQYGF